MAPRDDTSGAAVPSPPTTLESADLEILLLAAGRADHQYVQLGPRSGTNRLLLGQLGGLGVMSLKVAGTVLLRTAATPEHLTIQFDVGSDAPGRHNGYQLAAGDFVVMAGAAEYERRTARLHHGMNFRIPLARASHAVAARDPEADVLPGEGLTLVAGDCAANIARLKRYAEPLLRWMDGPGVAPLSPDFASAHLADALLDCLLEPWRRRDGRTLSRPYYQRRPVLQRSEAFMRAHLATPLMLHDICAAANAGERTVEYAFHDTYGMGAMRFLKMLRLSHVRSELRRSWASGPLVRDLAARCGFWHMGHFTAAYRAVYGETPRQTLRRGRA